MSLPHDLIQNYLITVARIISRQLNYDRYLINLLVAEAAQMSIINDNKCFGLKEQRQSAI